MVITKIKNYVLKCVLNHWSFVRTWQEIKYVPRLDGGTEAGASIPIVSSIFEDSIHSAERQNSVDISEERESISALLNTTKNSIKLRRDIEVPTCKDKYVTRTQSLFLDRFRADERKPISLGNRKMKAVPSILKKDIGAPINACNLERRCSSLTDISLILKTAELSPNVDSMNRIRLRGIEEIEYNDSIQDAKDCDEDCSCRLCSCSSCCEDSKCDITNSSMDIHEFFNDETNVNSKIFHAKHHVTLHECK